MAQLVARGYRNRKIAVVLGIREQSVKNLVSCVLTKLGCGNRTQVALALLGQGRPEQPVLKRVATAAAGIPLVLTACLWREPYGFAVLMIACFVIGMSEAIGILTRMRPRPLSLLWAISVSAVWIAPPLAALGWLYAEGRVEGLAFNVRAPILLAFLPLWAGDTAAIFAGRAFGRHPLAPAISPKKTWEGAIANFVACVLGAWGAGVWVGLAIGPSLAIGALTGTVGQAGDLFESWLKRKADLKDSGTLLPGHGGLLDRIDSLLPTILTTTLVYGLFSGR